MVHAKTAVADRRWARIGSTNLNISSCIGNWELDVVIEDEDLAQKMSEMFLEDLAQTTEMIISSHNKVRLIRHLPQRKRLRVVKGSGRSALSGMARIGSSLNAAVTGKRILGRAESSSLLKFGMFICFLIFVAFYFPRIISYTAGGLLGWTGFFILVKAIRLRYGKRDEEVKNIESEEVEPLLEGHGPLECGPPVPRPPLRPAVLADVRVPGPDLPHPGPAVVRGGQPGVPLQPGLRVDLPVHGPYPRLPRNLARRSTQALQSSRPKGLSGVREGNAERSGRPSPL